jgi:hypothetical protein
VIGWRAALTFDREWDGEYWMLELGGSTRPVWDICGKKTFAIIGMMRSGSNLLERTLDTLADVCCHGELFNGQIIGFRHTQSESFGGYAKNELRRRNADLPRFFSSVLQNSEEPVVGYRVFADHNRDALINTMNDPRIKKIVLRRNYLQAFISNRLAAETGQWIVLHPNTQKQFQKMRFDIDEFSKYMAFNCGFYDEVFWLLNRTKQDFFCVDYNELTRLQKMNEVAEFIGSQHRFSQIPRTILRQLTPQLREKVENFDEMVASLQASRLARYCL